MEIHWDWGTGYDLFFSLHVLHRPEEFGLRGSWAAGVRSRLSLQDRKFLEDAQDVVRFPLPWVYSLPEPKDGSAVLSALRSIEPAQRLPALFFSMKVDEEVRSILQEVQRQEKWESSDLEGLQEAMKGRHRRPLNLSCTLDWWARAEEFGAHYLQALQAYHDVFFAEEERRIRPVLQQALSEAQQRAGQLEWPALLEELSQGVSFASLPDFKDLVLVPSYWSTPFIVYEEFGIDRFIFMFGARPAELSLVPGEAVPDALVRALKALADPTRLRILRYLAEDSLTPSQLARQLRLRPPTVLHHLNALRLAGLVRLTVESGGEKRYAVRIETVSGTFSSLEKFLNNTL